MIETTRLTNQFIIAMPGLRDENFSHAVTYICEHNDDGALGIVINRPLKLTLSEVLEHMELPLHDPAFRDCNVLLGGPVQQERGFVLHTPAGKWNSMLEISKNIAITTSRDIMAAIANGGGPGRKLIALGYAGWAPGQLEQEMAANAWLNAPADESILFDLPHEQRWEAAAALVGIDLRLMSPDAGHA